MGPVPLGGSCERGKVPSPWEPPSPAGRSARTEREIQRLRGECSNRLAAGRAERDQHRWSWPPCCTLQPEMRICWCAQWLGAETRVSADRPGEGTGVGCMETAQRGWSVAWAANGGVHRMKPRSAIEAPLLMHAKGGAGPYTSSLILQ